MKATRKRKPAVLDNTAPEQPEPTYIQQVHAVDNGSIVLVASTPADWHLCCSVCRETWEIRSPLPWIGTGALPDDIRSFDAEVSR